jgi:hypothetical protein
MTEARTSNITLVQAWNGFFRYLTPRLLLPLVLASWTTRFVLGKFQWWDLGIVLIVLATETFTEWLIHVLVLHFKPRQVFGRRVDPYIARKHRAHHADPKNIPLVFIPTAVLLQVVVVDPIVFLLAIPDHALAVTAIAATYTMLGAYEWTHYLIHSPYRPKRKYYSYLRRAHWNHHFKNEKYWFGITIHLSDHLFGTFPEKSSVETSPTARTLGVP